MTGCASDPTARMGSGSAEIETIDGRAVLRPTRNGSHKEELLETKVAVKNVAFGQSVGALQIERSQHLSSDDCTGDVRRVFGNFLDDAVAEQLTLFVPGALPQMIRDILHKAGEDVLAFRRQRIVGIRRDDAVHP